MTLAELKEKINAESSKEIIANDVKFTIEGDNVRAQDNRSAEYASCWVESCDFYVGNATYMTGIPKIIDFVGRICAFTGFDPKIEQINVANEERTIGDNAITNDALRSLVDLGIGESKVKGKLEGMVEAYEKMLIGRTVSLGQ